jgi:DNA-binding winged helix-turn-helix (wHTH) protein
MSSRVHGATRRTLRFGPFYADLWTRELRKNGIKLKVHGMPFEVLAALLERPGDLVTREELQERLWPGGTFVDFENSLNSAVARLRDALSDSAENPRFIETLPKRGYRFMAAVEEEAPESSTVAPEPGDTASPQVEKNNQKSGRLRPWPR